MRPQTGVCKLLTPDVMAPEANAAVYVKSVDLLYLAWWVVTQRTSKMTELSKFKGSFKGSFK